MADDFDVPDYEKGKAHLIRRGEKVLFIGYGNGVGRAIKTADILDDLNLSLLDLRFVKPLDEKILLNLSKSHKYWFVFSDSAKMGGAGSAIEELLCNSGTTGIVLESFEYDDRFIVHGNTERVEESLGLLPHQLAKKVRKTLQCEKK
jgi:1-deoxy-D-xylulose-5-phosphate synthase